MTKLGIILPCYNEEEILESSFSQLSKILKELLKKNLITPDSFLVFVDDGSSDGTWDIISSLSKKENSVKGLKLAHNVGHQNAILAGLMTYKDITDCLITIDVDLQDDIVVIEDMIRSYQEGTQIVYGVRKARKTDTWFKRQTALSFYRIMRCLGVEIIPNHADYRLASKKVLNALEGFSEVNLFLRGIFPLIGFKMAKVYYDRLERNAGETKYPLKKMVSFAINGITSLSVKPLRLITVLGLTLFIISLLLSFYVLISYMYGDVITGWISTVLPIYLMGGLQLLTLGIIGEYIGKIYTEVKRRPRYIVEKSLY